MQIAQILYGALLTMKLLNVNEHKMTVAERYWILVKKKLLD